MNEQAAPKDFVDRAREGWERSRPDLDVGSIEIMGRIGRIGALSSQRAGHGLLPAEVTRAEFDVLCTLARAESPLRASEITASTMLSGASTSKNTDRLVKRGLIERLPWERDGRVVLMRLTPQGRELVDSELPRLLRSDQEMLAGLTGKERELLAVLLRKVALSVEAIT
ncbi:MULTISPECIES: MarR family winged helix-turn-helix transcriptional regulator [Arthrobacter]|uniref:MarR family winged helix-turn-helix transcriptional regulator n=1 Tax=unclassified Arthrobacter TaxID=235627 RepID=UPI0024BA79F7|nr:MarR family transcriptional regulator [Arthrobacter sp. H35-MC1]MDJ0317545.1 MarR family transcriptional regulator [Arthrobacter sp. H35-MC1]